MDNTEIGAVAGRLWSYLSERGECDSVQAKFAVKASNSELFLAAGWLAREDKIKIEKNGSSCRFSIKAK